MTFIRNISHIVLIALLMNVVPMEAKGVWDSVSGWFERRVRQAQSVGNKVRSAAAQAKQVMQDHARNTGAAVAEKIVTPVVQEVHEQVKRGMGPLIKKSVDEVEKHAKPAIQRAVKDAIQEAEKHVRPVIDRTEKRIHQNTGKLIAKYCAAGLGGIVGFCVLRNAVTRMTNENSDAFSSWLQRQDAGSTLSGDALIGTLVGMGLYGVYEAMKDSVK